MKTKTQIINEALRFWLDKCSDHWYNQEEPDAISFDGKLIEEDVSGLLFDHRPCQHVCNAVAEKLNEGEWQEWLSCAMSEELERTDPYTFYGVSRSDFA